MAFQNQGHNKGKNWKKTESVYGSDPALIKMIKILGTTKTFNEISQSNDILYIPFFTTLRSCIIQNNKFKSIIIKITFTMTKVSTTCKSMFVEQTRTN